MESSNSSARETVLQSIRAAVLRKAALSVFVLVALWNISVSSHFLTEWLERPGAFRETLREIRDVNIHIQQRFYQLFSRIRPIRLHADDLELVYIDDVTHWTHLHGNSPTDRSFLATLVRNASTLTNKARVIGIDIELLAPRGYAEGDDDDSRQASNAKLLAAIQSAVANGVSIVIGNVYYTNEDGRDIIIPSIYRKEDLRNPKKVDCQEFQCPTFGYINVPSDKRTLPLNRDLLSTNDSSSALQDSFALAIAKAVRPESIRGDLGLLDKTAHEDNIFASFLPESSYHAISALTLSNAGASGLRECAGKILLIGGRWHDLQGYGAFVDTHISPAGTMSGLGLHANYVASLLQHQFAHEPPLIVGIFIDLLVGLTIYTCYEIYSGWRAAAVLCLAFAIPIVSAYFFLVMANLYLDFLLPIELYFFHIFYEMIDHHMIAVWPSRTID